MGILSGDQDDRRFCPLITQNLGEATVEVVSSIFFECSDQVLISREIKREHLQTLLVGRISLAFRRVEHAVIKCNLEAHHLEHLIETIFPLCQRNRH